MTILCNHCKKQITPIITFVPDGDWKKMKAECPTCHRYIKILSQKEEKKILNPKKQIRRTTKLNIAFDLDCCLVDFMGGFETRIQ